MKQLKRGLQINCSTSGSEVSNPYEMLFQSSLHDTVRIHKSSVGHPEIFFGSGSDFSDGFGSYMNLVSLKFLSYILPYRLKHCKCVRLHITTRYKVFRGIFYKRNLLHGSGSWMIFSCSGFGYGSTRLYKRIGLSLWPVEQTGGAGGSASGWSWACPSCCLSPPHPPAAARSCWSGPCCGCDWPGGSWQLPAGCWNIWKT